MRKLQNRKGWSRDRISLLENPSPPPSPSPFGVIDTSAQNAFQGINSVDSFEAMKSAEHKLQSQFPPGVGHTSRPTRGIKHKEAGSTTGALQFVPAYEEATSPGTQITALEDSASWDAIARSEDKQRRRPTSSCAPVTSFEERGIFRRKSNKGSQASVVSSTTSSSPSPPKPIAQKSYCRSQSTSSEPMSSSKGGSKTRISRFASLFSSRAVVRGNAVGTEELKSETTKSLIASSPPQSDASSGYVGWPGTQDKLGATVAIQSSYEDSDIGQPTVSHATYDDVLEENADREVTIWMDEEPSFGEYSHKSLSPIEPQLEPHHMNVKDDVMMNGNNDRENPADYHLAAAVADAAAAASSPMVKGGRRSGGGGGVQNNSPAWPNMTTPSNNVRNSGVVLFGNEHVQINEEQNVISPMSDPWVMDTSSDTISSPGTSVSKTSSAYLHMRDIPGSNSKLIATANSRQLFVNGHNKQQAASVMRMKGSSPQPPTEETLALNDHLAPPHKTFNATNAKGYRGLLDKTKDVPNLIDGADSDSTTSRATSSHSSNAMSGHLGVTSSYRTHRAKSRNANRLRTNEEIDEEILEEASSDIFDGLNRTRSSGLVRGDASVLESDVFDGISHAEHSNYYRNNMSSHRDEGEEKKVNDVHVSEVHQQNSLNLVLLGGGLTTIQTTAMDFSNRMTASDYDENLTNSDIDQYGFTKIPGFHEMASAGRTAADRSFDESNGSDLLTPTNPNRRNHSSRDHSYQKQRSYESGAAGSDSGSSLFSDPYSREEWGQAVYGDLSKYYVHPEEMKKLVKTFRKISKTRSEFLDIEDLEREEDATKAFALSEMRSRIMEKDIERGLERRGGTIIVDDLVLTSYNRAASRVRDAVIVSKAWRDGANPQDVINTALLTRRAERTHYINRAAHQETRRSPRGFYSNHVSQQQYKWEEVTWVDDTDFHQFRCPSLGARHMRGFEIFTIGDCQSMLLKLSNDRCMELREELNAATARQIEAEDLMKEETDMADGMMTEAEMTYLTSMEEVKVISHKLVIAEKGFNLVRERIEKLVARYEALLVKIDNEESCAASSVITYESSYYSDGGYSSSEEEDREKADLARRAQKAELRAELAAREALLAKQQANLVREEKERELEALRNRLSDLQSESSTAVSAEKEHSVVLAKAITSKRQTSDMPSGGSRMRRTNIEDIKRRFRDRTAAKMRGTQNHSDSLSSFSPSPAKNWNHNGNSRSPSASPTDRSELVRAAGEEMYQHLDFYERSLQAVDRTRHVYS